MVTIDLITGFLGSGKTTFIKRYAKYLMDQGLNIGILENDFGAVNVDMLLLQELMGDKCELEMIAGGCDRETHRRRFRTKLIAMGMCGYDRVLVEPSGVYDVDEFFDVLRDEPLDRWYKIGNVITVVNAKLEPELSEMSEYLLASEAAHAGVVVLSRAEEATEEEMQATITHLNGEGTLWPQTGSGDYPKRQPVAHGCGFCKDSAVRLCAGKLSENGSDRGKQF